VLTVLQARLVLLGLLGRLVRRALIRLFPVRLVV
jgi:hypothetical protein